MSSLREQIIQQVVTVLNANGGVGCPVYRSRVEAATKGEGPFIVVGPGPDRVESAERGTRAHLMKLDRLLMVAVAVYTRRTVPADGSEPSSFDQVADPFLVAAHYRLMADPTLGGLAKGILPGTCTPDLEASAGDAGVMVAEYGIRYRHAVTDLDQP